MNTPRENNPSCLLPRRPWVSKQQAVTLATNLFNLHILDDSSVKELDGYDDRNFFVRGFLNREGKEKEKLPSHEYVLKVVNHMDSNHRGLMETQSDVMSFLQSRYHACPVPVPSIYDTTFVMCKIPKVAPPDSVTMETNELVDKEEIEIYNGEEYCKEAYYVCAVRLLTFVPGQMLHEIPLNTQLCFDAGFALGRLHQDLKDFGCPKLGRDDLAWNLATTGEKIEPFLDALDDHHFIEMIQEVCESFRENVTPKMHLLPKQVIHGDANYTNMLLVRRTGNNDNLAADFGFIDFSDINYSCRVFDLAISLTYCLNHPNALNCEESRMAAGHFFAGYYSVNPLSNEEIELLPVLIASRFCQTLVYGAFTSTYLDPGNSYLMETSTHGWKNFEAFWKTPKDEVLKMWLQLTNQNNYN